MQIAEVFASQLAFPRHQRASQNGELMAAECPGPYGIGSDTWPGLSQLAADAAQIARRVGAIIGDDRHQDTAGLRASLQEELGDLRAAIDYVVGKNDLDWDAVNRRRDRKRSLYERAHAGKAAASAAAMSRAR
jgi:hypothetical protein